MHASPAAYQTVRTEDREKPISFDVPLEAFLIEDLQFRRRDCITVIAELTSMGLANPVQVLLAWRSGFLNETWLIENGKVDRLEVADVVKCIQIAGAALQFKTDLSKALHLDWMVEGKEEVYPIFCHTAGVFLFCAFNDYIFVFAQVRRWLGIPVCDELARLGNFDLRFARDILRPPPAWYELASEPLKKVLNDKGFSFAKLLWGVVSAGDEMQKMKLGTLDFVCHLGVGSYGVCSRLHDRVSRVYLCRREGGREGG